MSENHDQKALSRTVSNLRPGARTIYPVESTNNRSVSNNKTHVQHLNPLAQIFRPKNVQVSKKMPSILDNKILKPNLEKCSPPKPNDVPLDHESKHNEQKSQYAIDFDRNVSVNLKLDTASHVYNVSMYRM